MISTIIFDFYDTITHKENEKIEEFFKRYDKIDKIDFLNKTKAILWLYSLGRIKNDEELFKWTCSITNVDKNVIEQFYEIKQESEKIGDNIISFIKNLKVNYKIALATNGVREWIYKKLNEYGIESLFDAIVVSSEIKIRKPDPRPLYFTIRKMDINPNECIFVSDELNDDLSGAKSLGIRTAWLKLKDEEKTFIPDIQISNLSEIENSLRMIK